MSTALDAVPAGALRSIAGALRSGQLSVPLSKLALSRVANGLPETAVAELSRLSSERIRAEHLALLIEAKADIVESRLASAAELVWTGPEVAAARSRDTAVVLAELFRSATSSVLVSTFVIGQVERVFAPLARRMAEIPQLKVQLFLHVDRGKNDTRYESEILREFATELKSAWPGAVLPIVYYAPSSLSLDPQRRATWHAKAVVIDDSTAFVTSANFTEWAQERNVEAGVIVRNPHFACQLRDQFESLVRSKTVLEVPGLRT
jgi:phosphatidylserine/phosphatidylglycerophosphate/cardiolipin synthase-like enzyme